MNNEIIFVSGQRGSGKSYWVRNHLKGLSRYLLFDTLAEYNGERFEEVSDLIAYVRGKEKGFLEGIFDPLSTDQFPYFCRVCLAVGNLYAVIEEIDLFSTPYQTPIELQKLIKYGRHKNVNIIGVSRRPSEVSRLFTSQTSRFIIFTQREPRDVAYFRSIIGEWADHLPSLPDFHYLDIDFSKGTPTNPIKAPVEF